MYTIPHQELDRIKEYVVRDLPESLEGDQRFAALVEKIVSNKFLRRDELKQVLTEWPGGNGRHPPYATHRDIENLRAEMRQGFRDVDRRLTALEEDVGGIKEDVKTLKEEVSALKEEVSALKEDVSALKEEVSALKEDVSALKEDVRIIKEDIKALWREMHKVQREISILRQEVRDTTVWMELTTGRLRTRIGHNLEDVVAAALRLGLQNPNIRAEHVRLRQEIVDTDGVIFRAGRRKEVDIIATDGELLVFEVKSAPKVGEVEYFADKVELVRLQNPDKQVRGILVALGVGEEIRRACRAHGLMLLPDRRSEQS